MTSSVTLIEGFLSYFLCKKIDQPKIWSSDCIVYQGFYVGWMGRLYTMMISSLSHIMVCHNKVIVKWIFENNVHG